MFKVVISYNIQAGKEQECQEYLVNKLAPGLARMGFQFQDLWYTVWGQTPEILGGGEVESMENHMGTARYRAGAAHREFEAARA
jgi:hypothetical protein